MTRLTLSMVALFLRRFTSPSCHYQETGFSNRGT